ncbi:unnamed protein product, partial [Brenthis ino]
MDSQHSQSNVCVISLDALDLNYLHSRYEQKLKQPLYSAKNSLDFSTNFYYEFELQKDEEFDVFKENELVYITCHICKIQVPQNFYHEHKYSFKHEMNTKIANLAVQRLQKHLNCNYDIVDVTTNSSAHFCPVCVTVMDSVEKKTHENSIGHKNSVIVEKFLNDFLILYENVECKTIPSIKCNIPDTNSKKEMDIAIKKIANISKRKDCFNENEIKKVYVNEDKEKNMGMKDYLILLKEKFKIEFNEVKLVNENNLLIKTVDNSLVRVNTDSFHSFKQIGSQIIHCVICKEVFDSSTKHKHILTNKHMELVWLLPFENKDCMRHIDETWNHCVLCNLGLENVDAHLLSAEHVNNLKMSVLYENNNCESNKEASTSSCKSSNDDINKCSPLYVDAVTENHSQDLFIQGINKNQKITKDTEKDKSLNTPNGESTDVKKISVNQMKQVENVHDKHFCIHCNTFISKKGLKKHSDTAKHCMNTWSNSHYFMTVIDADDTDYYLCRVCDEKVKKPINEVKKHVTLPTHLQNYNALLSRNSIKKIGKDIFFCSLCSVKILIKNEILHINSRNHKLLCDPEAQNTLCAESRATSSNSLLEKNSNPNPQLPQIIETNKNIGIAIKETKSFFCDICNVKVPNSKHNIETHIKGGPHIKNMQNMFDKKVEVKKKDIIEGKINIDDVMVDKKLRNSYYVTKTNNPHILKCIVCDIFMTNNETNIGTHVKGFNHLNNYTVIIEKNHLEIKDNDVYCKICSVHISIGNEISHCKGKKHMNNLPATTSS